MKKVGYEVTSFPLPVADDLPARPRLLVLVAPVLHAVLDARCLERRLVHLLPQAGEGKGSRSRHKLPTVFNRALG
jgi:hypothetical protein